MAIYLDITTLVIFEGLKIDQELLDWDSSTDTKNNSSAAWEISRILHAKHAFYKKFNTYAFLIAVIFLITEIISKIYISNNGTENITIIHLNESTPPINIKSVGWITSNIAKISLRLPELSMFEPFIDAEARM